MGRDVDPLNEEIKAAGASVFAGGLHPSSTSEREFLERSRAAFLSP